MRFRTIALWALVCAPDGVATSASTPPAPRDPSPLVGLHAVPAAACSLVAAAGFTVVQSTDLAAETPADVAAWVARARAYLDTAHRHGLRVLLDVPINWPRQHRTEAVREAVHALRDHPAICAWYEGGEIASREIGALQFLDRIISVEDPAHGFALDASASGDQALGLGRARSFDYRPVTRDSRRSSRLHSAAEQIPIEDMRVPLWVVLQAYGFDLVRGNTKGDLLMPTRGEMEASLASALVAGARGIFFAPYMHPSVYGDHAAPDGKRGLGGLQPLPSLAPEAWASVCSTAQLASRLLQALAGADRSETLRVARAPRGVEVGRWDTAAGVLVVIANLARRPAAVELACDEAPGGIDWFTAPEHALQVRGRRLELLVPATSGLAFLVRSTTPVNARRP